MKAFYSDTFVLPLPEQHRFPMTKYRLLRERLVDEGILSASDLHVPDPISWDDLRFIHDAAYGDAVAGRTLSSDAQHNIPVVVAMSGGYAPDVDAIVTIHANTIREAVGATLSAPSLSAPSHSAPSHLRAPAPRNFAPPHL